MATHPPRWKSSVTLCGGLLCVLLLSGCQDERISTVYGRRSGIDGKLSVNGTAVLADMFAQAGHNVRSKHMLTDQLMEFAEVIVWAPDDFSPPSQDVIYWFDKWLAQGGRTLIYIGRDFDAGPGYYTKVIPGAPVEQAAELKRRQNDAVARHRTIRGQQPNQAECSWFSIDNTKQRTSVSQLEGPWSVGLDASKVEIVLDGRIQPRRYVSSYSESHDVVGAYLWEEDAEASPELRHPLQSNENSVLLRSGNDILVSRQRCDEETDSEILLIANGSFVLNLPLVNREHRVLGKKLVDQFEPSKMVVFVESGIGGPKIIDKEPSVSIPSGLTLFSQRPLDVILLHLIGLGIILCVARWPIFGRPRKLARPEVSDFGKHVDALGDLLRQTGDKQFADHVLATYRQNVHDSNG